MAEQMDTLEAILNTLWGCKRKSIIFVSDKRRRLEYGLEGGVGQRQLDTVERAWAGARAKRAWGEGLKLLATVLVGSKGVTNEQIETIFKVFLNRREKTLKGDLGRWQDDLGIKDNELLIGSRVKLHLSLWNWFNFTYRGDTWGRAPKYCGLEGRGGKATHRSDYRGV
jgi:hypothetical protein